MPRAAIAAVLMAKSTRSGRGSRPAHFRPTSSPATPVRPRTRTARSGRRRVTFALIPMGVLPLLYAMPLIGLVIACGTPPDVTPASRPVALTWHNLVIGTVMLVSLAVVALQPQLLLLLVTLFGVEQYALVVTLLAVAALALPLALQQSDIRVDDQPPGRFLFTRRNLILSATALVTVATWYATAGQSFLMLAALVLAAPVIVGASRARHAMPGRVELGLLRRPLRRARRRARRGATTGGICRSSSAPARPSHAR